MEAYTSTLVLLPHLCTHSLTHLLICPHNILESHLKLAPRFWTCFIYPWCEPRAFFTVSLFSRLWLSPWKMFLSFQIEDFETCIPPFSSFFLLLLSPKVKILNISAIYKAIILMFLVNLWYLSKIFINF